jgi:RNA polymerase sigma factor (sigma-70 family)
MPTNKPIEYGGIYKEMRTSLIRYASRYFKRSYEVEDVVQEAFLKVIEAHGKRDIDQPKHYLFRTTRNLALKEIAKKVNKLTDQLGDFPSEMDLLDGISLEDDYEAKERLELACQAIRELPLKCRQVFIYRRVYGYSHKEIADEMGISVKTIEAHLTRAILHCSEFMDAIDKNQPQAKK